MSETARIPIIKLYDNLIISIQVSLSDRMVQQLKDDVTEKIADLRPTGMVIDLSGIDIMDSYISRAIRDLCIIARLMGVATVISGMDHKIAMTLVEMGVGLEGVDTKRDLEGAIEYLQEKRQDKISDIAELTNGIESDNLDEILNDENSSLLDHKSQSTTKR
jgi:rsbT antagonist protein RsbS